MVFTVQLSCIYSKVVHDAPPTALPPGDSPQIDNVIKTVLNIAMVVTRSVNIFMYISTL